LIEQQRFRLYCLHKKTANDLNVATVQLANEQVEAQGVAALALIQAISQINDRLGSNLDVKA